jgi:hypothetical protein
MQKTATENGAGQGARRSEVEVRGQGSGFSVQGSGFRVQGSELNVEILNPDL